MPREPLDPVRPIYVKPPSVSPVPAMDAETERKLRKHFHADEAVMPTTNETISRLCGCQESYWPERLDDGFMLNGKPCYPDRNEADALAALEAFRRQHKYETDVMAWTDEDGTDCFRVDILKGNSNPEKPETWLALVEDTNYCAAVCAAIIAAGEAK